MTNTDDTRQTFWLGEGRRAAFVLLHPAASRDCAVLLCPPYGFAESSTYRDLRVWAATLAAAGYPVARLSLPGTGNSGGSARDGELFEAWVDAVSDAAEWLREAVGARRLAALGVGLGGFLAALAAQRGDGIDELILWGVPAQGRALVRQERTFARIAARNIGKNFEMSVQKGLQHAGLLLTDEMAEALGSLSLLAHAPSGPALRRVLLLSADGPAADSSLAAMYRASGAEVELGDGSQWLHGVAHNQQNLASTPTFTQVATWLRAGSTQAAARRCGRATVSARAHAIVDEAGRVRERALRFTGAAAGIYGVLSEPADPDLKRGELVGLWVGPYRMFVEISRRWAAQGVPTVRIDLMGCGESSGDGSDLVTEYMYSTDREPHVTAVLDQLAASGLGAEFVIGGYCAGAYWALQATLSDRRVVSAMLINLYTIRYSASLVTERSTVWTLEHLHSRAWHYLSKRDLTVTRLRRGLRKIRTGYLQGAVSRPVEQTQGDEWRRALAALRSRGTDLLLMLGDDEALLDEFRRQGILDDLALWPNLTVKRLPNGDHLLWQPESRRMVNGAVDAALARAYSRCYTRAADGVTVQVASSL